jgi:putative PEP-CTERM system histidine kinase
VNLAKTVLILALLTTILPVVAVFLRGRARRLVTLSTVLASASVLFLLGIVLHLVQDGPRTGPDMWVYLLMASAVLLLLAGYLFSFTFGRDHADQALRASGRTAFLLIVVGAVFLALVKHPGFVRGYDWAGKPGVIQMGSIGKAFLCYLLVGIVLVGYNLERTYRIALSDTRYRLRVPLVGLFFLLAYQTFLLASGMLYSSIGIGKLVALSLPVGFASVTVACGFLKGAITDVNAPVSRNIVYSSFTAVAAGLFVLAIGVAAQVATLTRWSPDEILVVSVGFLALMITVLFLFSTRFQRRVRRYIDRNFYVNRYDYRTQWSALTEALSSATDRPSLLDRAVTFLGEVFATDIVTIALRDRNHGHIRVVVGKGSDGDRDLHMETGSALHNNLSAERKALLLDRKSHDFTYIPIYAENGEWLDATASRVVAPLFHGDELMGTIGLERKDEGDPFSYEDVSLLDSIAGHLAAALRSADLAREVAETREMELMSQWSSMLLHDLKNYLHPMRMVATNLVENRDHPDIATICAQDINRVADRIETLVQRLSELRHDPTLGGEALCPNQLVRDAIGGLQVEARPTLKVDLALEATQSVRGDRGMLRRVVENLVTNAVEAMSGSGTLKIRTQDLNANGFSKVYLFVEDTGPGMTDEFVRERLFRPFATTKKKGLGIGLYQCRSIVHAHGGELLVRSRQGEGSVFQVVLGAAGNGGREPDAAAPPGGAS